MLELIQRLLHHPTKPHHFIQSRSHEGMVTCKACRFRMWPGH